MRKFPLWCLLGILFLVVVYLMADYDTVTGTSLPAYSSRRYDPYGSSAFRELLTEKGRATHFLERPVPPRTEHATLMMTLPANNAALGNRRADRLWDWVRQGNRLLMLSRNPPSEIKNRLLGGDGEVLLVDSPHTLHSYEARQASGDYQSVLEPEFVKALMRKDEPDGKNVEMALMKPSHLMLPEGNRLSVLAGLDDEVYAVSMSLGQGRVILLSDPTPVLNYGVNQADNADILISFLASGDVYFDEYSLGLGYKESMMDWLKQAGLVPFLLQAMLVLYLLARSGKTDFGVTHLGKVDRDANAEKQIRILAALYENTLSDKDIDERWKEYGARAGVATNRK